MLDVAKHVLRLQPLHHRPDHLSRQNGILAQIFKRATVARFAGEIDASAERHVEALRAQFAANQRSVFIGRVEIPTRSPASVRGQRGRVAAVLPAAPHSIRRVRHLDGGNAQPRNARDISRAAIRMDGEGAHRD